MPGWALGLYSLFVFLAFGLRTLVHYRRTGRSPWVRARTLRQNLTEAGLKAGGLLTFLGPLLAVTEAVRPAPSLTRPFHLAGLGIQGAGITLMLVAQAQMGTSWRAGVDPEDRTALVTRGVFRLVRNPFYDAMILVSAGTALAAPSVVSWCGFLFVVAGAHIVVRFSEEPYLRAVHGSEYERYLRTTGRFAPRLLRGGARN